MNRVTTVLLGALVGVASVSGAASGQQQSEGARWLAWTGCWEGSASVEADTFLVCIEPSAPGSAELTTYSEGELVALETVVADGEARPFEEGGCQGVRVAEWSEDGSRLFISSDTECGNGVNRRTSGVLAMLPGGAGWVEVQSVDAGDRSPVVGIRTFSPAGGTAISQQGAADPAAGREVAVATARTQAGGGLDPVDIVELVERAGPPVTSALLVERGERFGLDTNVLASLSDHGVPAEVVDVMVAVSYPERFEVTGGGADVQPVPPDARVPLADRRARTRAYRGYSPWAFGFDLYWDSYWSSGWRLGYSNWGYPLGLGYGYGRFGYSPFGYGRYGYPGYVSPRVIFIENPQVRDRGARLSRETGVVPSGSRDGAASRPAISRTRGVSQSPSQSPSSRSPASPAPAQTRPSGGGDSGASSGGDVRRARPRN